MVFVVVGVRAGLLVVDWLDIGELFVLDLVGLFGFRFDHVCGMFGRLGR